MTKYLTVEEILRLHYQVVEDFGGSHGVRDEGRLQSVVVAPGQSLFGAEQYPGLLDKAAVYLRNIIGDHPFVDGNKRTAVTVAGIFLIRNGTKLKAEPIELADFAVKIAVDHLSVEDIATWLKGRVS